MILVVLLKRLSTIQKFTEIEDRIPDSSSFVKKTDYNTKITEIEGKIRDITGLAKKTALTTVENKIPSISGLVKKKTDYNTKITDIEKKLNNHNHDKHFFNDNDLSYYRGKQCFDEGSGKQNYLVFLPMGRY